MLSFHKRKVIILISLILSFILCIIFCACGGSRDNDNAFLLDGLVVKFLDVGEGDATIIRLPDGKVMLFDTGANTKNNKEKVISSLKDCKNELDYLVLSHPDKEHYGNAIEVINALSVKKAFIPNIINDAVYPDFYKVKNLLDNKGIEVEYNSTYIDLSTDSYVLFFIYPDALGQNNPYVEFNSSTIPNDKLADDISPIIYLEYLGVRFIFIADASKSAEDIVLTNYKLGLYDYSLTNNRKITLENIDYYKLSSHGGNSANSLDFLSLIAPKNAVISVGSRNGKGHPSTEVLSNLYEVNKNYNLYRTDRDKTIIVHVDNNGKENVIKEK